VKFSLSSGREPEIRDVTCQGCGAINQVNVGIYKSGIMTIFCKECGEEIMMTFKRTPDGLELKHREKRTVDTFKAIVDDAFKDAALNVRQDKAAPILSEAKKHLSRKEFQELEKYIFEKLR